MILSTMITPYRADGSVDYDTAEQYVDWYYQNSIDGIFAVCQSSEIFFLSLEERVELNRRVYARAKRLSKDFLVVSSGHVSDTLEEQARELNAIYASGTDALILITNRLDPYNEGDDVFIANTEKLLAQLPSEAKLGMYECPHPYKRLVTPKILDWCLSTGRFYYMKDTCCDTTTLAQRAEQLRGSCFKLLNANGQTLLESMRSGAQGYCGIMCNFHPKLYAWLDQHHDSPQADVVQAFLTAIGFCEALPYPLTAKYHMGLCGIPTELQTRMQTKKLTEYHKNCIRQLKIASDALECALEKQKAEFLDL